jgi:hypothetical protein
MSTDRVCRGHRSDAAVFGLGVVAGALAVARVIGRRAEPRVPDLAAWQRALAETHGQVRAGFLAGQVQARFKALYAARPRFAGAALQFHLDRNILPGLALYQVLREELEAGQDSVESSASALAEVDQLMEAALLASPFPVLIRLAGRLPWAFHLVRLANRLGMRLGYPPEGWITTWLEDSEQCVAFDITGCFYLDVLTDYGAPELTPSFCRMDDLLYGHLDKARWGRTETLARGFPRCDFRFIREG